MPGMMDTVLNLGLNDQTVEGLAAASGDARFAYDSYRRFIQMYADVVLGVDHYQFEEALEDAKQAQRLPLRHRARRRGAGRAGRDAIKAIVAKATGKPFPQDPKEQLWGAIGAVFGSWKTPRAVTYRRLHSIPSDLGTAVTVQAMVFGNMGDDCATGVAFTRNPSTGEKAFYGEFLVNAQGEDVVAGIRTPQPLTRAWPPAAARTAGRWRRCCPRPSPSSPTCSAGSSRTTATCRTSSSPSQRGKLWMLQTRTGKRTAPAALKIAVDMVERG